MSEKHEGAGRGADRREFLKTSAAAGAAAVAAGLAPGGVFAAGGDQIKVGVIGCGGRGRGAAINCLEAAPNVQIVALGDVFRRPIDIALSKRELGQFGKDKVDVPPERQFVGLDAYQKVLDCDINYVILATPPGFRPLHLQAAVAAGKHIFTEKPVGVDGPGIRKVLEAYEEAKKKNLAIAAGTQRRHQKPYIETINRLHDGAIGKFVAARCYWNGPGIWFRKREPGMSDVAYQIHNWYHFLWLCGDHIVEQHVHNLDVINWVLQAHPLRARGMGGRTEVGGNSGRYPGDPKEVGHIFDHFAVELEYPDGVFCLSECRHIPGCWNRVGEDVFGTKGMAVVDEYRINGKQVASEGVNPYVQEHTDLIASIRGGKPINELKQVAESTLTAILGRMATYTGKEVTWEQALNSKLDTFPQNLTWEMSLDVPPVPVPGKGRVV